MKKQITLVIALSMVAVSCAQWGEKVKGNGNFVTIERSLQDYDHVAVAGSFDVDLVAGHEGQITLEGESNLLEYVLTEVKNGKLLIKTENGVNLRPSSWTNGIRITVPIESLDKVSLSGSGDIVSRTTIKSNNFSARISGSGEVSLTVEAERVDASLSGSGDITLAGRARDFVVSVSGSGEIQAYGFDADFVNATVSGSADIKVTVNESLEARVSGSGDIYYRGNPSKINTKTSGSGDISKG